MHAARARDERRVGVVVRLEGDDLVAVIDEREDRRRECLRGTGGHEHLGCRVDLDPVPPLLVRGDRLAQHGHADARRVLVHAVGDGLPRGLEHLGRSVLVGEALPEVDRAGAGRECAHLGEDRGRDRAIGGEEAGARRGALPGPESGCGGEVAHALTVRQGGAATLSQATPGGGIRIRMNHCSGIAGSQTSPMPYTASGRKLASPWKEHTMTDTTDGPTGEAREGDVTETAATQEPTRIHARDAGRRRVARTPCDADAPPRRPPRRPPPRHRAAEAPAAEASATGTVYQPGQAPQPYRAPAVRARHRPRRGGLRAGAGHRADAAGARARSRRPSAAPARLRRSPPRRVAGVPPYGAPTAEQPAPKQRRVGLGVAAAIVAAALIGGASGAGITALIASNQTPASSESADSAQNIVVNDTDSVNQITAVAAKASPSVVTISVTGGQSGGTGSGIILSEDGYVLTNTHVVTLDGATGEPTIQVKTNDGHLYTAELVGTDPLSDLAVIKLVDASGLTPLEFADSDKLNVGDTAIAIGAPLGLSGTVTNGIVSALNRSIDVASSAAPDHARRFGAGRRRRGRPGRRLGGEPVRLLLRPARPRRRPGAAAHERGAGVAAGHPDGCRDQPGQLGRRAARLRGQAHRRERRDPLGRRHVDRGRQHRRGLRGSRRTSPSASRRRSSRTARRRTACSARRSRRPRPTARATPSAP